MYCKFSYANISTLLYVKGLPWAVKSQRYVYCINLQPKRRCIDVVLSLQVPERSAARTVGIQEDEREVVLTRYGVDIEMSKLIISAARMWW